MLRNNLENEFNIEHWLTDEQIAQIEYSDYWNDEEVEKSKEWYILDGNFSKMETHLKRTGLSSDLERCVRTLETDFGRRLVGTGIDLAAGNLWAAHYIFALGEIEKLYCLEMSKHRLFKLGPKVLDYYGVPKQKVVLVCGSFYDVHLENQSLDFVLLAEAFHHAGDPLRLLSEIDRTLKPDGVVIVIGEHVVEYFPAYLKHVIKFLISRTMPEKLQQILFRRTFQVEEFMIFPSTSKLFPPHPILGDHRHTTRDYKSMFSKYGFRVKCLRGENSTFRSFLLVR